MRRTPMRRILMRRIPMRGIPMRRIPMRRIPMRRIPMRRIVVVGTSGSGKTTMARQLARRLEIPHVELDALYWGPNWTPAPREVFRQQVERAIGGHEWATDGNYSAVRDIVWGRADTIVWLDYSLPVILWRVTTRTIRRAATREKLWNDNQENFSESFFSRDSIILFALQSYRRRRREYPILFARPEYAHLNPIRLCSPGAARRWLNTQVPISDSRRTAAREKSTS
jgi:adenylate kinase family enzyme